MNKLIFDILLLNIKLLLLNYYYTVNFKINIIIHIYYDLHMISIKAYLVNDDVNDMRRRHGMDKSEC